MTAADDTSERLIRMEDQLQRISGRLAALEQAAGLPAMVVTGHRPAAGPAGPDGTDTGEAVFTISGQGEIGGNRLMVRQRARMSDVLETDPDVAARVFAALASPARITVLRSLLQGPRTSQQLRAELDDASVGQLYHHLRELLAAGLIIQPARSQYAVPRNALTMLCVQLMAAARLASNISLPIPPDEELPPRNPRPETEPGLAAGARASGQGAV